MELRVFTLSNKMVDLDKLNFHITFAHSIWRTKMCYLRDDLSIESVFGLERRL